MLRLIGFGFGNSEYVVKFYRIISAGDGYLLIVYITYVCRRVARCVLHIYQASLLALVVYHFNEPKFHFLSIIYEQNNCVMICF